MARLFIYITFKSVKEFLWCYYSNEISQQNFCIVLSMFFGFCKKKVEYFVVLLATIRSESRWIKYADH